VHPPENILATPMPDSINWPNLLLYICQWACSLCVWWYMVCIIILWLSYVVQKCVFCCCSFSFQPSVTSTLDVSWDCFTVRWQETWVIS